MQPIQIAMSGVIPGSYGTKTQVPTFTVDAKGRLTFAANVDIQTLFRFKVNEAEKTDFVNLSTDVFNFRSGYGIILSAALDGIHIDLDKSLVPNVSDFVRRSAPSERLLGNLTVPKIDVQEGFFGRVDTKELNIGGGGLISLKNRGVEFDFTGYATLESSQFVIHGKTDTSEDPFTGNVDIDLTSAAIRFVSHIQTPDSSKRFPNGQSLGSIAFQDADADSSLTYGAGIIAIKNFNQDESVPTGICILTSNGIDNIFDNPTKFTFSGNGVFEAPVIKIKNYSLLPSNPEKGWVVFDETDNKFKGWNGGAWIILG